MWTGHVSPCSTVVTESTCLDHADAEANVFCREVIPSFGPDYNVTAAVLLEDDSVGLLYKSGTWLTHCWL